MKRLALFLLLIPIFSLANAENGEFYATVKSNRTNIREEASQESKKAGQLNAGDIVTVLEEIQLGDEGETWYRIIAEDDNELEGYIRSDLVKKGRVRIQMERDLLDYLQLPERSECYFLQADLLEFDKGRRFPVYTGPGKDYVRGEGIAAVSTNGKIQVFGQDENWVLIQYSILGIRLRIGYIEAKYLPEGYLDKKGKINGDLIGELEFEYRTVQVKEDTILTDDPLFKQNPLLKLRAGTKVTRLGYLEGWTYVEYFDRKTKIKARGFIRGSQLRE